MQRIKESPNGSIELLGEVDLEAVQALRALSSINQLEIRETRRVGIRSARWLGELSSVKSLWLWCQIWRKAFSHVLRIPDLTTVDLLAMSGPGRLPVRVPNLQTFRCNIGLSEIDLLCIAKWGNLRELAAQSSELTSRALGALLELSSLTVVDLESTGFKDAMAWQISRSKTIEGLDLGGANLTRQGLGSLLSMQQLTSLDLWATRVTEDDLVLLHQLPRLEYVSIGGYEGNCHMDARRVIDHLIAHPSLKRVWLDGVVGAKAVQSVLEERFASVRIT